MYTGLLFLISLTLTQTHPVTHNRFVNTIKKALDPFEYIIACMEAID